MAITSISRDWGSDPSIVRITTTDSLATITTSGYLTDEASTIASLNNGAFEWLEGDMVLINFSDGEGFFTRDSANATFVAETDPGSLSDTLQDGRIFVGNAGNVATGVAVTGDIGITNTGVTSITADSIVNADVNSAAAIAYSKLAALPSAQILVGSGANVATAVAMSGDVAIDNAGATTIQANAVETSMILDANVTSAKLAEGLVQHVQVDVDLATFVGAYTASVLLVANPGANKKLILHRATLWIDYGGTPLANGGAVHIQYANTANGAGTKATGTIAAATLINATADTTFGFSPVDTTLVDSATLNQGLYFAMATQDFTGGDASAYKFDVWYSVADFS